MHGGVVEAHAAGLRELQDGERGEGLGGGTENERSGGRRVADGADRRAPALAVHDGDGDAGRAQVETVASDVVEAAASDGTGALLPPGPPPQAAMAATPTAATIRAARALGVSEWR